MEFGGRLVRVNGDEITIKVDDSLLIDTLHGMNETQYPEMNVGLVDKRHLSSKQRRKAYATMNDMAEFTGFNPEDLKAILKNLFYEYFGSMPFSFVDADMTTVKLFISFLLEFCFEFDIPLKDEGLKRTEDIDVYMLQSMRHRKCAVCMKPNSDIHHIDVIGMGNNRKTADHRGREMICLCREHHQEAHKLGWPTFSNLYHVVGEVPSDELIKSLKLMTQKRMDEIDE
ncbi:hypothetical protein LIX87_08560 [Weissella viridescens]|uniref:putative HNHc nuclease n=1 Tax=Weissella viridescens TaxID=1629 RepID=UPI001D086C20|nr:putative HNHc nuclease [Weissella viridescens]MCB6841025.1 hypothetical protein [Weissella viridescens]MCB6847760.1 hypothetical protein [Weissella viridescens]